jgi:hypothetical protein
MGFEELKSVSVLLGLLPHLACPQSTDDIIPTVVGLQRKESNVRMAEGQDSSFENHLKNDIDPDIDATHASRVQGLASDSAACTPDSG